MEIKQIKLGKMGVFCYLVGDESSKTCALIDPAFDTGKILAEVKKGGYQVTDIINTHCHSDHTAGNAAMIAATDARLSIHELDAKPLNRGLNRVFSRLLGGKGSPGPDMLLKEGDVIEIGETTLKVLHTPGHTMGSICLYTDGNVFTGDTLFVGAVGRTDLAGGSMELLLKSVHEKIYTLPGEVTVWPGHDYGPSPCSTVELERRTNPSTRA
ncbi:MAG: MBL fold metallo-hydrolase [Deltaproteobacteria bacterium]|nr:MBL fold metallo-hydrolase [Deltaproteobacteria bacterium]